MGLVLLDHQFLPLAESLVKEAKKEILLSSFKFEITDKPRGKKLVSFFNNIILKAKEGVKIFALINWHDDRKSVAKTNWSASHFLKNAGVHIRFLKNNRCCHAKMILVDREKAVIGSHNLSVRSCEANFEVSYLLSDQDSVSALSEIFMRSYNDAKEF